MSQVKRVRQGFDLMELGKEYVLASDYDSLEAECAKLREALRECLEAMEISKLKGRVYVSGRAVMRYNK